MVYSYDLFGQIAISLDDTELYLNSLPNFTNSTSRLRRQNYADCTNKELRNLQTPFAHS